MDGEIASKRLREKGVSSMKSASISGGIQKQVLKKSRQVKK